MRELKLFHLVQTIEEGFDFFGFFCGIHDRVLILVYAFRSSRSFTSLCYSADGESILAGGQSKFVCIYNVKEQMLMKKFEISCNLSFDAMEVRLLEQRFNSIK